MRNTAKALKRRPPRIYRVKVGFTVVEMKTLRSLAKRQDRPISRILRAAFLSYFRGLSESNK